MRLRLAACIGFFAMTAPAVAQTVAPTFLIGGEMAHTTTSPSCYVNPGYATFQRNLNFPPYPGTRAVLTFPSAYCGGNNYSGTAVLVFNSATTGTIRFTRFPTTPQATTGLPFVAYSEKHTPGSYETVVNFTIPALFPVALTLEQASP